MHGNIIRKTHILYVLAGGACIYRWTSTGLVHLILRHNEYLITVIENNKWE